MFTLPVMLGVERTYQDIQTDLDSRIGGNYKYGLIVYPLHDHQRPYDTTGRYVTFEMAEHFLTKEADI